MELCGVIAGTAVALSGAAVHAWWRARSSTTRAHTQLERATMELQRLQQSFGRFAPQEIVERIVADGVSTAADKKDITVMFADIVGSTRLGEQLTPDVLVRVVNGYFARMSRVITEHRGHVGKFIGDGLMATFGMLEANPWQANDAAHAALAMRDELARYNQALSADGLPPLAVGVGVHRGPVVAGLVGSPELMEFTAIGNTVNVAARVEGLTRVHGVDLLVSRTVRDELDPRFRLREMAPAEVHGVADPITTYALEGFGP